MKFVYVDESGNNNEDRFLAFFGIQIDGYRLKKAMREVKPVLEKVANAYPGDLREIKSSRMVNGKSAWRGVDPDIRKGLFLDLCGFPATIGARAYAFVLDRQPYNASNIGQAQTPWRSTPWLAGATAIALFAQRTNQGDSNNKGLTVLIFDDNKVELPKLSEYLISSSTDADEFYGRTAKSDPFDHIIDTAFAIKSEHSTLVQISDACAYALRRRAELTIGGREEEWNGETGFIEKAFGLFSSRVQFPAKTWVKNPSCDAACWIRDVGISAFDKWVKG